MKKTAAVILAIVLILTAASSCGGKGGGEAQVELTGTLEEIMETLNTQVGLDIVVYNTEVTADNAEFYLGTSEVDFAEALASDPMMSAIAHSVVLIRMEPGADIEAAKTKIRDNADPRKWICVGVEQDEVIVDSIGSVIMLVMSKEAAAFDEAFLALAAQ